MMLALLKDSQSAIARNITQSNAEISFSPVDVHPSMVNMNSKAGDELKAFIQQIFFQAHGARIKYFMPQALSLRDNNQQLLAVAGLRSAQQSPFFLERYLRHAVEQEIAAKTGLAVERSKIVEIGNLAVTRPAYTKLLMAALSAYLYSTDTEWIVFSALPVVKNAVAKMDHHMLVLADATINEIAEQDRADWGSYYAHHPQVIALRLKRNGDI
jgi:hypothetical protein